MLKHYRVTSIFLISLLLSSTTFAKTIQLFDEPKKEAKVVGTLDSDVGIISIYTPKNSEWIKVADPRNGNVGWIKSTDMNGTRMNFNVTSTGNGGQNYQIIQYGNAKPLTPEQIKQMHDREAAFQRDMQKMMHDMFYDFPHPWMNFPVILPVMMVPEKAVARPGNPSGTAPAAATTPANAPAPVKK
jgi:hypothetical protein